MRYRRYRVDRALNNVNTLCVQNPGNHSPKLYVADAMSVQNTEAPVSVSICPAVASPGINRGGAVSLASGDGHGTC